MKCGAGIGIRRLPEEASESRGALKPDEIESISKRAEVRKSVRRQFIWLSQFLFKIEQDSVA
jgi:hypothetical protein